MENGRRALRILLFGEILFDLFPDGARLGGAPLNLAVHLHRLGAEVQLISAVGRDGLGEAALAEIARQGIAADGVARVGWPTGTVSITLDAAKVPAYCFAADCAYDHIPPPELPATGFDLFCFGTLAQRGEESRATLRRLLAAVRAPVFCDVNLRQDFYSREILETSLSAADIVKLNEEELPVIGALFGIAPECGALAARFSLSTVILTLGPRGCTVWRDGATVHAAACPARVVSTVGAGDAFSAAFLHAFLTGEELAAAAAAGNRLAAEVASQCGAF